MYKRQNLCFAVGHFRNECNEVGKWVEYARKQREDGRRILADAGIVVPLTPKELLEKRIKEIEEELGNAKAFLQEEKKNGKERVEQEEAQKLRVMEQKEAIEKEKEEAMSRVIELEKAMMQKEKEVESLGAEIAAKDQESQDNEKEEEIARLREELGEMQKIKETEIKLARKLKETEGRCIKLKEASIEKEREKDEQIEDLKKRLAKALEEVNIMNEAAIVVVETVEEEKEELTNFIEKSAGEENSKENIRNSISPRKSSLEGDGELDFETDEDKEDDCESVVGGEDDRLEIADENMEEEKSVKRLHTGSNDSSPIHKKAKSVPNQGDFGDSDLVIDSEEDLSKDNIQTEGEEARDWSEEVEMEQGSQDFSLRINDTQEENNLVVKRSDVTELGSQDLSLRIQDTYDENKPVVKSKPPQLRDEIEYKDLEESGQNGEPQKWRKVRLISRAGKKRGAYHLCFNVNGNGGYEPEYFCLLYTSPSPRD